MANPCVALTSTLVASLTILFLTLIFFQSKSYHFARHKRSLDESRNQFFLHNRLHKVFWTKREKLGKRIVKNDENDNLFIAVKTSQKFHHDRLDVILKTWFKLAQKETWFFSDSLDRDILVRTNGHLVNTKCSSSHNRSALNCKMGIELKTFLKSNKRWFCHFDDDNYVNIPQLRKLLQKYDNTNEWYLGKTSVQTPLEVMERPMETNQSPENLRRKKLLFGLRPGAPGFVSVVPWLKKCRLFLRTGHLRQPEKV